jgi:hypothetical protein
MVWNVNDDIERMQASRDFGINTCPASRHVQMIAEALAQAHSGSKLHELYPMLEEEPEHCAGSIASVLSSLYQTRSFLKSLGYSWRVNESNIVVWEKDDLDSQSKDSATSGEMSSPGDKNYEI